MAAPSGTTIDRGDHGRRLEALEDDSPYLTDGAESPYLTDGVQLYRSLGKISGEGGPMVAIENCRSLEVILMPVEDIRRADLRTVAPRARGSQD